jgi:hypothetical protein
MRSRSPGRRYRKALTAAPANLERGCTIIRGSRRYLRHGEVRLNRLVCFDRSGSRTAGVRWRMCTSSVSRARAQNLKFEASPNRPKRTGGVDAAEKDGTLLKPSTGRCGITSREADNGISFAPHTTGRRPGRDVAATGLYRQHQAGWVWIMHAGTTTASDDSGILRGSDEAAAGS